MGFVTDFIDDQFLGGAERDAANAEVQGMEQGVESVEAAEARARGDLAPIVGQGDAARDAYGNFIGLGGPDAERAAINSFMESPGQKFLRERGERTVLRNQAALGGLRGGNVMKELTEFGIGTAAGQLGERKNRLAGVADAGNMARYRTSGITEGAGVNIANLRTGQGAARASGIRGVADARRNTMGQVAGMFTGSGSLSGLNPFNRNEPQKPQYDFQGRPIRYS